MKRRADTYIEDIGKTATVKLADGTQLTGVIAIRFGRLVIEQDSSWTSAYAAIHDDSEITVGSTP